MPISSYPVMCYAAACPNRAEFKIAARWSDGITTELKTYSLACPACLPVLLKAAMGKRAACRLAPGETLDALGVYEHHRGDRDQTLLRRADLEANGPA